MGLRDENSPEYRSLRGMKEMEDTQYAFEIRVHRGPLVRDAARKKSETCNSTHSSVALNDQALGCIVYSAEKHSLSPTDSGVLFRLGNIGARFIVENWILRTKRKVVGPGIG